MLDGHQSRYADVEWLEMMQDRGVYIWVIPPNTTWATQALDQSAFAQYNKNKRKLKPEIARELGESLTSIEVELRCCVRACRLALSPFNIQASFAQIGVHPWNPQKCQSNVGKVFGIDVHQQHSNHAQYLCDEGMKKVRPTPHDFHRAGGLLNDQYALQFLRELEQHKRCKKLFKLGKTFTFFFFCKTTE